MSKKGSGEQDTSKLAVAAAALDTELGRYAELAAEALRVPLTSEKNIDRSARALLDAAECEKRVMAHAQALVAAITDARTTQEATSTSLVARADAITQRRAELEGLLARFAKLGEVARGLGEMAQKIASYKPSPYEANGTSEVSQAFEQLEGGMVACAEHAASLAKDATDKDLDDLARQADGLRQQILSAKNRLSHARSKIAS